MLLMKEYIRLILHTKFTNSIFVQVLPSPTLRKSIKKQCISTISINQKNAVVPNTENSRTSDSRKIKLTMCNYVEIHLPVLYDLNF